MWSNILIFFKMHAIFRHKPSIGIDMWIEFNYRQIASFRKYFLSRVHCIFRRGMRELEIKMNSKLEKFGPTNQAAEEIFAKWLLMLRKGSRLPASVVQVNLVFHLMSWICKICITVIYETTFFFVLLCIGEMHKIHAVPWWNLISVNYSESTDVFLSIKAPWPVQISCFFFKFE